MKVENIEVLLVCVIVLIQLWVFIKTYIQIGIYRRILPNIDSLKVIKISIPIADLENLSPKEILGNLKNYKGNILSNFANIFEIDNRLGTLENEVLFADVSILQCEENTNFIFDSILFSLNNYLIRNRGAASDFNLIKDIVERNSSNVEEDINLSIAIPLYLGLMGTMIGIVIGLFNMPNLAADLNDKDTILNQGINLLIGGVKIAMIASFTGLLLTILNTGWVFKGSRSIIETKKNDFYTFIQIELLPIINQGVASTLESLQRNLLKFNNELTLNLKQLNGVFNSNVQAINAQKELLLAIDKTKVGEMTKYNIAVLKQLDLSVDKFQHFNGYLTNVNQFVENSQNIVTKTNELLGRTESFQLIADNLDNKLTQSQKLLEFLSTHFTKLEEHKEFTQSAVAEVGYEISSSFNELREHIQKSSDSIKQFTIGELDALKNALSESKTNLSNLEHLETLNKDVSQFKNNSTVQANSFKEQLIELNMNMTKSLAIFEKIENNSFLSQAKGFSTSIKGLFKSKSKA